ncbi:Ribonuclease H, putative, partial [Candida maltosa Xu316]
GASFKKFETASEANAFVSNGGGNSSGSGYSSGGGRSSGSRSSGVSKPTSSYSSGGYSSGGYSSSSRATTTSNKPSSTTTTKVYVDGAARGNGRSANAPSGYGVYYGENDSRNAAVPLDTVDKGTSFKPTNQRAELHAVNHALRNIHNDLKMGHANGKTEIHSDSKYAIQSVNEWSNNWAKNDWKNSKGETVANYDLMRETVALKNSINQEYKERNWGDLEFHHVKGHAGNKGNEAADRLANQGADKYGKK